MSQTPELYAACEIAKGSRDQIIFHSRNRLTENVEEYGSANGRWADWCPVMRCVIDMPGVVMVHLTPYRMLVTKNPLYSTDLMAQEIVKLLVWWNGFAEGKDEVENFAARCVRADVPATADAMPDPPAAPAPEPPKPQVSVVRHVIFEGGTHYTGLFLA